MFLVNLNGVYKNQMENPTFQMCSYLSRVGPGPPKTPQSLLNQFILHPKKHPKDTHDSPKATHGSPKGTKKSQYYENI